MQENMKPAATADAAATAAASKLTSLTAKAEKTVKQP